MRLCVFIVSILTFSCVSTANTANYQIDDAITIKQKKQFYPPNDIEIAITGIQDTFDEILIKKFDFREFLKKHRVTIEFHQDQMFDNCKHVHKSIYRCVEPYNGLNIQGHRIYVRAYKKCLADTALIHELIHSFLIKKFNTYKHPFPWFCKDYPHHNGKSIVHVIQDSVRKYMESCK